MLVDSIWAANKEKVYNIVKSLMLKIRHVHLSYEELQQEAMIIFYKNFYYHWINDEQYIRLMYVSMKNKMLDIQNVQINYRKRFVFGIKNKVDEESNVDICNFVTPKDTAFNEFICGDLIDNMLTMLENPEDRVIFKMFIKGYSKKEICDRLDFSSQYVETVRTKHLQPKLKEVCDLTDGFYESLTNRRKKKVTVGGKDED